MILAERLLSGYSRATVQRGKRCTLQADLTGLKILDVEVGLDWALLIAFDRGKLGAAKGSRIYQRYAAIAAGRDVVIGHMANDRFFNGKITDPALSNSLSALKPGKQFYDIPLKNSSVSLVRTCGADAFRSSRIL